MNYELIVVLSVFSAALLGTLGHLWFRPGIGLGTRVIWTFVALVPGAGPLMYWTMFNPPSVQADGLRARQTPGIRSW